MSSPTVTVVIPTRNRVRMLAQTLHTALSQDVDLEVVVVDEGSTDDTPAFLAAIADPRVRFVRHDQPRGLANARNAGIDAARGRWVAFTDDDDLWFPGKLRDQLDAAAADGTDWAYGGAMVFRAEGPTVLELDVPFTWMDRHHRLPHFNVVPGGGSNAIVSRAALDRVGGFDTAHPIVADWDLWVRMFQDGPPAVVSRPVVAYRVHGGNMSNGLDTMLAGMEAMEERYAHLRSEPLDWANLYRWLTKWALRAGDAGSARRIAFRAVQERHTGSGIRLLRASLPFAAREPVSDLQVATGLRDRLRQRTVVGWPTGSQEWLRAVLEVEPAGLLVPS